MIVAVSRIPLPKTERYLYWVRVANKTDADRASVPLFLWRDSNVSVVNDLPVAGQSRP